MEKRHISSIEKSCRDPIRAYTRVSPRYLPYLTDNFLAELDEQGLDLNLAIGDLGHDVFADFRYNSTINQVQANDLVMDALATLNSKAGLALNDPSSEAAPMADYTVNVSRVSSQYASFYSTIPFRQLALRGLTGVVGQDVNLNSRDADYYLMQAAELGMGVKYTVTAQNPDILKSSHFESLYAASWEEWKDEILKTADACAELRAVIGGKEITNHVILAKDVFETTYEGGLRVISNYTALPYESADGVVEAGTWLLVQEGGSL